MSQEKQDSQNKKFIDLSDFDNDDQIDLIVLPPKNSQKILKQNSNDPFNTFLSKNNLRKSTEDRYKEFKAVIQDRKKSKMSFFPNNQKKVINVDSSIAPSLHTRSKGEFSSLNQFVFKDSADQDKQFKEGRYEFADKAKNKQKKVDLHLKQAKLPVINLEEFKDKKEQLMKIDGPMYPWRRKSKPQESERMDRTPRGIEFTMIKNNGYLQYQKDKERRKLQRQENRKKQKQKQQKEKQERVKHLQNTFYNLLGLIKPSEKLNENETQLQKQDDGELKNLNILDEIQNDQKQMIGYYDQGYFDDYNYEQKRRLKYGLDEIIKPYDCSHALPFVKAILGYKFKFKLDQSSKTKRIPQIFSGSDVYKKTFHYLVINECITDIHQRLKKIQKDNSDKILIQVNEITQTAHGMTELRIRELGTSNDQESESKKFLLKNYSMSKNRMALITNKESFSLQQYGIISSNKGPKDHFFAFLCMLKTPESKQQVKDPSVIVSACIDSKQLDYIIRSSLPNKRAYFYDIQKLSTSIREYMSISNVEYSYLSDHIYNPNFIDSQKRDLIDKSTRECIQNVFLQLKTSFNNIQFESIRQMVLRQRGIVLLQGPPGTGKTSTLLGLLAAQYAYLKKIGDKRKIMICAPSNAAIDHITKRLRTEGLFSGQGNKIFPKILRLGIVETEDKDITGCSLDHICENKVIAQKNQTLKQSNMTTVQIREETARIQKKIRFLNIDLIKAQRQRKNQSLNQQKIAQEIKELNTEYIRLQNLAFNFRREKIISKKIYQELEKNLLKDAEILIVTLSSSGGQKMELIRGDIACLIVDEAAQATQPSLLIALQTGVEKVMLIGDPSQLPATTLSSDSNKTLFNRSLFQRFIDAGIQPYFLNIQYRMMPMIRTYPSEKFYQGKLVDGQSVITRLVPDCLRGFAGPRSVIFIDIKGGQQKVQESSFCNFKQAGFITKFLKKFCRNSNGITIGLITPYQAQRKLLMKQTQQLEKASPIMINTIDSFQGQEKDLILISTVRSNDRKQIGFLMDERRINVSVTRAKYAMIIVGNGDTLGSNEIWDGYLKFIEKNKLYFQVNNHEDEDKILSNLTKNDFFNPHSVRRRFYSESDLTFDPRKIKVDSISENDLKKRVKKAEPSLVNQSIQIKKRPPPTNDDCEYQAEELIKKKRKQQEQAEEYEKTCERLKAIEQEKANDDFYKFLFQ